MNKLTANDVMTADVLAVRDDWPLERLAEFLVEHAISGAPVLSDDDGLVGVVSLTDIARHDSLPEREAPSHHPPAYFYHGGLDQLYAWEDIGSFHLNETSDVTVRDIMTPTIFRVDADDPVHHVADMMVRGHIHRVLVTHGPTVIGIITAFDLLRVLQPPVEQAA